MRGSIEEDPMASIARQGFDSLGSIGRHPNEFLNASTRFLTRWGKQLIPIFRQILKKRIIS